MRPITRLRQKPPKNIAPEILEDINPYIPEYVYGDFTRKRPAKSYERSAITRHIKSKKITLVKV